MNYTKKDIYTKETKLKTSKADIGEQKKKDRSLSQEVIFWLQETLEDFPAPPEFLFVVMVYMLSVLAVMLLASSAMIDNIIISIYLLLILVRDIERLEFYQLSAKAMDHTIGLVGINFIIKTVTNENELLASLIVMVLIKTFTRGYLAQFVGKSIKYITVIVIGILIAYAINSAAILDLMQSIQNMKIWSW